MGENFSKSDHDLRSQGGKRFRTSMNNSNGSLTQLSIGNKQAM